MGPLSQSARPSDTAFAASCWVPTKCQRMTFGVSIGLGGVRPLPDEGFADKTESRLRWQWRSRTDLCQGTPPEYRAAVMDRRQRLAAARRGAV
jgi:hypothetical protein